MSCAYDKERLTAFFDGELDAAERAETERHISGCSECLRDLGEIKSAASAVKTLARPRAPRALAEGVAREIAAAGKVRRLDVWRGRLLVGVAAAAVVLIALNISFFSSKPPTSDEPLARSAAPVNGMGTVPASDGKDGQKEAPAREDAKASERLLEKGAADKAPSDGADHRARRETDALKKADSLDRDRAETEKNALRQETKRDAPLPAPKPEAKPQAQPLAAKTEAKLPATPAPAPGAEAPAPAAPPPAPPAAKAAPAEETRRKVAADEKAEKAGELQKQVAGADPAAPKAAAAPGALPSTYTVRGGKDARAQAEALVKSWAAPAPAEPDYAAKPRAVASGAPSGSRSFGALAEPLVVDVTPEQFEALRAELAKAGVTIEAGAPESLRGGAGKDLGAGGGAFANKERAEQQGAADAEGKLKTASPKRRIVLHFVVDAPKK